MTTALDRQRIRTAREAALRNRLLSEGLTPGQVDRWVAAWLERGEGDPLEAAFWGAAWTWIDAQRSGGRRAP